MLANIGLGWKRAGGGQTKTRHQSLKSSTDSLSWGGADCLVRIVGILGTNGWIQLVTCVEIVVNGVDTFGYCNLPYPLNPHVLSYYCSFSLILVLIMVVLSFVFVFICVLLEV